MANAANEEAKRFSMECIETALLSLMREKAYDKITYHEIAQHAGVSRNAIYRNFTSADDILDQYFRSKTEEFLKSATQTDNYRTYLLAVFRHLETMKEDTSLMLKAGKEQVIYNAFLLLRNHYATPDEQIREYYDYYRIGGIYSVYLHWVENGCRETPEELCEIVFQVMRVYGIVPNGNH